MPASYVADMRACHPYGSHFSSNALLSTTDPSAEPCPQRILLGPLAHIGRSAATAVSYSVVRAGSSPRRITLNFRLASDTP